MLQEERRGIPAKLFFKIDLDELMRSLQAFYENDQWPGTPVKSRMLENHILDCGNPANNDDGFQQTSLMDSIIHTKQENTTEITPENTSHHHPVSDDKSAPDRASNKNDDDDTLHSLLKPEESQDDRKLIAELVSKYRGAVPPAKHSKNDYSFTECLYCDTGGYHNVDLGIKELGYRATAGLIPDKPLAYLRQIIKSASWDNKTRQEQAPGTRPQRGDPHHDNNAGLKRRLAEKERKYADIYLS